ncbi:entericidin EcnAB [Vibrio viridaestus]|uniref:Entericidin EcnAB n=1 Tax=Vibrio viridaestus TaxID=2487322 RepID=A0A3N9THI3_9VIBR|nr:entericidin EcnAB [Vibrio viridaestus]RQW63619.1 entericidin EcnAB [Vibrio viridaestus]
MKLIFSLIAMAIVLSGCSNTWDGAKKDSKHIWSETKQTTSDAVEGTKEAIHKATE